MGIYYHRRIKLCPFIWLNISTSGLSLSVGVPGASINFGGRQTTTTISAPGTGISYRKSWWSKTK